jgi:hypothetical protein
MNIFFSPKSRFHFAPMFNWLMRRTEISAQAKLLYIALAQHSDENGFANPSRQTLCEAAALTERSCDRYMHELKQHGLIVVQRLGQGKPNQYMFPEHAWMEQLA